MLKVTSVALCLSWLVTESLAGLAPFIQKCKWNDRACLVKSSQIAIPYFANGIPAFGMTPLDPMALNTMVYREGELELVFKDVILTGAKKCQVKDIERNNDEKWIRIEIECPVEVHGNYVATGKLFTMPIEGKGPFSAKTDNVRLSIRSRLNTVNGADGQKYWELYYEEHAFEVISKTVLNFENLFNGDKDKAAPILNIFDQNRKDIAQAFSKPIVAGVLKQIDSHLAVFFKAVPVSELEI